LPDQVNNKIGKNYSMGFQNLPGPDFTFGVQVNIRPENWIKKINGKMHLFDSNAPSLKLLF